MFFYGSFASGRPRKFFRPQRLPRSADFGTLQKFAAQNRQTFEAAIPLLLLSGKMSATPIVCRCRSADFGTHQKYAAQSRQTFEAAITFPSRVRQDLCDANSLPVPGKLSRFAVGSLPPAVGNIFHSKNVCLFGLANHLERNCFAARDPQIVGNGQCWQDVPAWLNFTCDESTL